MGFFDTLIDLYKRLREAREERIAKQFEERANRGKTFVHDDFFGKMEYKKGDEYLGNSYRADYYEPQFKKQISVLIESDTHTITNEQKELYKLIVNRFEELESKMFENLSHKIAIILEEFHSNFEFFQIIINKPSLNKRRWFASYGHIKEFGYHYLGFSFEEFEVVEVVITNNKGEEI